jgi:hypothetical protein
LLLPRHRPRSTAWHRVGICPPDQPLPVRVNRSLGSAGGIAPLTGLWSRLTIGSLINDVERSQELQLMARVNPAV